MKASSDPVALVIDQIRSGALLALVIDDLSGSDLDSIAWSGGPLHPASVAEQLTRAARGEVDYLAVRAPDGTPVAIGGVDFAKHEDSGELWQFAVHPRLQGRGIGTRLIGAAESRIRIRGRPLARIGVEDGNVRARALYERLGYAVEGHEVDGWHVVDDAGQVVWHEAQVTLLAKPLPEQ